MTTVSAHYMHHQEPTFPPHPESASEINPSLLVSWWCTLFSCVIILVRVFGRWIRTERLFAEDKLMALAVIPLFARMGCVHYVLKYGTNNVVTDSLTPDEIAQREIGSKLVLAARVFYAMFIWIAKLTIADFLHRIYSQMWTKKHDYALTGIRWFLVLTYFGVFISILAECQPFYAYWQVIPDPGYQCRDSFVQLVAMGVFDSITDLILVAFPLPIIISSNMKLERKVSLSLLFSMSLILVGITIYRVQATVEHHFEQRFRSLLASFEILAATGVANAIVLGSFLRDRGIKKKKFKHNSSGHDSVLDRPSNALVTVRSHPATIQSQNQGVQSRATHVRGLHSWGSDIDLVGDLGIRLGPEFQAEKKPRLARPAPAALPMVPLGPDGKSLQHDWAFDAESQNNTGLRDTTLDSDDEDDFDSTPPSPKSPFTPRGVNFFDVGGLLDPPGGSSGGGGGNSPTRKTGRRRRQSSVSFAPLPSSSSNVPFIPMASSPKANAQNSKKGLPRERFETKSGHAGGLSAFSFPPKIEDGPSTATLAETQPTSNADPTSKPKISLEGETNSSASSISYPGKKETIHTKRD